MGIEALGKEAFLTLLTTQLMYQDPLKPMESTDFIAQLAQFREMESAIDTNKKLDALVGQTQAMNSLSAAGLLGRKVEVVGGGITHEAGQSETITYRLPEDAKEVVIYVNDQAGNVVRTLTMQGLQKSGPNQVIWDGRDNNGNSVPPGNYKYAGGFISDVTGRAVPIEINANGDVMGISYEDGKVLALVNGMNVPVEKIVKIVR